VERERIDGAKIHLSGIEALLRGRGGIEGLATHPLLRAFAIWYVDLGILAGKKTNHTSF
jgi:hypothetical protein